MPSSDRDRYAWAESMVRRSARILQAEYAGVFVVGEYFGVARPGNNGSQCVFRPFLRHRILELVAEARRRGAVTRALVEHALDMRGERHIGDQVLGEQPLAFIEIGSRETHAGFGEADIAFGDFGEA